MHPGLGCLAVLLYLLRVHELLPGQRTSRVPIRQNTPNQQVVLTFWIIGPFAKSVVGIEFVLDETRRALTERAMCWREGSEKVAKGETGSGSFWSMGKQRHIHLIPYLNYSPLYSQ